MSRSAPPTPDRATRNRANARKSTGPRSSGGKALVSRNATQHGLLSMSPIALSIERQEDWDRHLAGIFHSLAPVGHLESVLAERLALQLWRLARVARYEAAVVEADQQALAVKIQSCRFQPDPAAPSTRAALEEVRNEAAADLRLLESVPDITHNLPIDPETALFLVETHARAGALADPCAHLPGGRPAEDLAAYCARHAWTGDSLIAALFALAQAAGLAFERLNAQAVRRAADRALTLHAAISDQEIATKQQARLMPHDAVLDRVQRYEAHLSRDASRTLRELERLQDRRTGKPAAPSLDLNVVLTP